MDEVEHRKALFPHLKVGRPKHPWVRRTYNIILDQESYEWVMKEAHLRRTSGAAVIRGLIKRQAELDQGSDMPPVRDDNQ